MWFKLSLLVLVCVMMVVLNLGGMSSYPCQRRKTANAVKVAAQDKDRTLLVRI
jgi:hypothetical protein